MSRPKLISGLIFAGFTILLAIAVTVATFRRDLIYQFNHTVTTPQDIALPRTDIKTLTAEDGTTLNIWVAPPQGDRPVILFFMGNFNNLAISTVLLRPFIEKGYGFAALEYRGSGGATGKTTEKNLAADARQMYDNLDQLIGAIIPPQKRISYGVSLGTGVAVTLASERETGALILESAYSRFCEYFENRFRGLPFCLFMWDERYDSIDRISLINAPLLMLHGEKDTAIPIKYGLRLYATSKDPKKFVSFPEGGHNDLRMRGSANAIIEFLESTAPGQNAHASPDH